MLNNILSNSLRHLFQVFSFFLIIFNQSISLAADNIDNTNTEYKLENKINNSEAEQGKLDFYIINLFKDAITIECEDSTLHKNQSLEIKTNDYIELRNCKDALIFYSNKSIKYGFDQRFNSRYYVIKKSRSPKLEIRVEVPTEQEGCKILNEVKNKHKE
ncbi:MAG: hypothetical protein SPK83_01575 [Succinivibrio dextrinosolvens]|nr:hypothetical protein [Succinivibrio dextrinosolvens]